MEGYVDSIAVAGGGAQYPQQQQHQQGHATQQEPLDRRKLPEEGPEDAQPGEQSGEQNGNGPASPASGSKRGFSLRLEDLERFESVSHGANSRNDGGGKGETDDMSVGNNGGSSGLNGTSTPGSVGHPPAIVEPSQPRSQSAVFSSASSSATSSPMAGSQGLGDMGLSVLSLSNLHSWNSAEDDFSHLSADGTEPVRLGSSGDSNSGGFRLSSHTSESAPDNFSHNFDTYVDDLSSVSSQSLGSGQVTPRSQILTHAKSERSAGYFYYRHVEDPGYVVREAVKALAEFSEENENVSDAGGETASASQQQQQQQHQPKLVRSISNLSLQSRESGRGSGVIGDGDLVVVDDGAASLHTQSTHNSAFHMTESEQHSGTAAGQMAEVRDWNAEFQDIIDRLHAAEAATATSATPRDDHATKLELYTRLSALVQDFNYVARTYGKIIILERYSPAKTIRPVNLGGVGGGEKFVAAGILFKFAVDKYGLYGDDAFSAKAAGNELKGLLSYYQARVPEIHVPLMTLVDFRGFRLVAQCIAPVQNLLYGSDDGGMTVFADDPTLNGAMELAAKRIGLKGHNAGIAPVEKGAVNQRKFLYGPTDIEGHRGSDGEFFSVFPFPRLIRVPLSMTISNIIFVVCVLFLFRQAGITFWILLAQCPPKRR
jgi:Clustered mitochondria